MKNPPYRVGVIDALGEKLVGYGTYEGDFPHPELGFNNPRIKLDNGDIIWGCECWWDTEERIKALNLDTTNAN